MLLFEILGPWELLGGFELLGTFELLGSLELFGYLLLLGALVLPGSFELFMSPNSNSPSGDLLLFGIFELLFFVGVEVGVLVV